MFLSQSAAAAKQPTMAEIVKASSPADWRAPDPENTLYVELPTGRVVIELAPAFAPLHVGNIKTLARAGYFNGLSIIREQDNYVAQWGDPDTAIRCRRASVRWRRNSILPCSPTCPSRLFRMAMSTRLKWGFRTACRWHAPPPCTACGWHIAMPWWASGVIWPSIRGSGAEMYVVIGHAPRHLDRNVALVGRVLKGMELLSGLPRGSGEMGFYTKSEAALPIKSIRVAADVPAAERSHLEVIRTDSAAFSAIVESRRNRPEEFFKVPAGRIDLCNVPIPVRDLAAHSP